MFFFLMTIFDVTFPCTVLSLSEPDTPTEWHISADSAIYDNARKLYVARGNVIIYGGETRLHADYVEFSNTTKDTEASGHVLLISGSDTITCDALMLNLKTRTGIIHRGTIFIQDNHFYIKGNKIEKTGKDTYHADHASVTTCPGDNPDWKISGKDIVVTIEGYATAKHATLWAKKMPAFYTPFLAFPVKTKRQTGLLSPRISSSDRKGFEYEQPFYLAISRQSDATFYMDHMTDRGMKGGFEYRYITDNGSFGTLFADYLDDRKIDDGSPSTKTYRFDSTPIRTNSDRYWLRMKHDQFISESWSARLDLDIASDADYLHEFKEGYTGFNSTNQFYSTHFGRSLEDDDDTLRKNTLVFNKNASTYAANFGFKWNDNVTARQQDLQNTTLQNIPFMELGTVKHKINGSPFYADLNAEYRSFYREDTTDLLVSGQRADIFPRIHLPLRLGSFYIEPSVGIRETMWYADEDKKASFADAPMTSQNRFENRTLYSANTAVSTTLSKIFYSGNRFAEKIRHDIVPKIEYEWISSADKKAHPFFDSIDLIDKKSLVTWSVTNRLTSKKNRFIKKESISGNMISSPVYREFAWFEISQSFDVNRERNDIDAPFSDIYAEMELSPNDAFAVNSDTKWSPYENHFTSHNTGFTLRAPRGDTIYTAYRYEREASESFYTRIDTKITNTIDAFAALEQNLFENETIESKAGFDYHTACWSLFLSYKDTPDDRAITFMVNLHGIGEFGTK